MHVANAEFRRRSSVTPAHLQPGEVDRLNGGGLFRKAAIDRLGYLTNRNLHGFEEYELALRLRSAGWRLYRLNQLAVKHYGHTDTSFSLLWRRWRSRYAWGAGELLREVQGKPYFKEALEGIAQYRLTVIVIAWWLLLVGTFIAGLFESVYFFLFVALLAAPLFIGMLRKRSFVDGLYMVVSQNVHAAGVIAGFFSPQRGDPKCKPSFKTIV
jgi:GT2 family glycosyltransferase